MFGKLINLGFKNIKAIEPDKEYYKEAKKQGIDVQNVGLNNFNSKIAVTLQPALLYSEYLIKLPLLPMRRINSMESCFIRKSITLNMVRIF